jgi:multisubunit Na+/H+ antiporter MnhF subunit
MAYGDVFHPAGTSRDIKVRGPVWVALWSITPYSIFWFYFTVKDLSEYGKAKGYDLGQNPVNTLLAVLVGWVLLLIPTIIALYRFVKRVQQAQRLAGSSEQLNGWLWLIMTLVGLSFVANGYTQSELNKAWAAEGGPVPEKENEPPRLDTGPSGTTTTAGSAPASEPVGAPPSSPEAPNPERPPGT